MTITVKQLSNLFDKVNRGKYKSINQIDENLWECNGFYIEKMSVSKEKYLVQYSMDDYWFYSLGDAIEFCENFER